MNEITITIRNKNKQTKKGQSNKNNKQTSQRKPKLKCAYCKGRGIDDLGKTCMVCGGDGRRASNLVKKCPICKGDGHSLLFGMPCRTCGGTGYLNK